MRALKKRMEEVFIYITSVISIIVFLGEIVHWMMYI